MLRTRDRSRFADRKTSARTVVVVSSDRTLALQLGVTSCGELGGGKWVIDDIPFDGPDKGLWIELTECETDINAYNYNKQSGSGTDIKYRPLAFENDLILYRKVFRSPFTLIEIGGLEYRWRDQFSSYFQESLAQDLGFIRVTYQDPTPLSMEYYPSERIRIVGGS